MANIIEYDIDMMEELVRACKAANEELASAQRLVAEVRSHQDWTCREKDLIDDHMLQIKKMVGDAATSQDSFFRAVNTVAEKLTNEENSIKSLFSSVEHILQKVLGIPIISSVVNGNNLINKITGSVTDAIGQSVSTISKVIGKNAFKWLKPIGSIINSSMEKDSSAWGQINITDFEQIFAAMKK